MNLHVSLKYFNLYFLLFNMFLKLCCNLIEWYKIAVINNKKKAAYIIGWSEAIFLN